MVFLLFSYFFTLSGDEIAIKKKMFRQSYQRYHNTIWGHSKQQNAIAIMAKGKKPLAKSNHYTRYGLSCAIHQHEK